MTTTPHAAVRDAFTAAGGEPHEWVTLTKFRAAMPSDMSHEQVGELLKQMCRAGIADLAPDSNTKTLRQDDHDAAVTLGGEQNHLISLRPTAWPDVESATEPAAGSRPW
jgi:hypothetical protein